MTSRSERKAGINKPGQSLRLQGHIRPPSWITWLGLRHHVIQVVSQRLLRRWGDEERASSPRGLVVGENLQPPKSDGIYDARIRLHLTDVHIHGDDVTEIRQKMSLKVFYLPSRLARRGGKSPKNAAHCVLREEPSVDVVGGHGGHPLSSDCLSMNTFGESFVMQDALNSQQKLIYYIPYLPPKVNTFVPTHHLCNQKAGLVNCSYNN